jgi:hypothetical protein
MSRLKYVPFLLAATAWGQAVPVAPAPLQAVVDTTMPAVTGAIIPVHSGGDLQGAYNSAQCGDELQLDAGATWTGNFIFNKQCSAPNWLLMVSSALTSLPEGIRVSPANAVSMAKIQSANGQAPIVTTNANNVPATYNYFAGLEVTATASTSLVVVTNALTEDSASQLGDHIFFSRMYVHGLPSSATVQMNQGFMLAGSYLAVVDSYVAAIYSSYADSQAILGAYGPGPYRIHNNYLEGGAENILFGGTGAPPGYTCTISSPTASSATLSGCVSIQTGAPASLPPAGTQAMFIHSGVSHPSYYTTINTVVPGTGAVTFDTLPGPPDSGPGKIKWGLLPQDIEITQNSIDKPENWNPSDPSYDGIPRDVKDHFEMKYGVRVLFQGNWCSNMWQGGQGGSVNLNSTDQNGDCPWCHAADVDMEENIFSNLGPQAFEIIAAQTYASVSGTVNTNGTTTVAFAGGNGFNTALARGSNINIAGVNYPIASIPSGNTLITTIPVPAATGAAYFIAVGPPAAIARVLIGNNLFWPTTNPTMGLSGYIGTDATGVGVPGGNIDSLQIVHNTMPSTYKTLTLADGTPYNFTNFVFRDNITDRGDYGIGYSAGPHEGTGYIASEVSTGGLWSASNNALANVSAGLDQAASNAQLQAAYGAMLVGPVVTGDAGIGYSNLPGVNTDYHGYQLSPTSVFHDAASDGTDVGVDFVALDAALGTSACTYRVSLSSASFSTTGGTGTVGITTQPACPWIVVATASWITIASGAEGSGSGSVPFTVAANPGAVRTGGLVTAGSTLSLTQRARRTAIRGEADISGSAAVQ